MLAKMVVNNNDNTRTLFWTNKPADVMDRYNYNYSAEIHNMYDHGVKGYENNRITVYERPTENRGCNDYDNTAHCIDIANELDDLDEVNIYDYFEDCPLDIEYTINSDLEYVGARIMIAFGGPNIYINTNNKRVELYWWNENAYAALSDRAVEAIDEYFEDMYNMRRDCL